MTSAAGWEALAAVLTTPGPKAKVQAALAAVPHPSSRMDLAGWIAPPERPARPPRPALAPPQAMPRRRVGSLKGRIALLHALAHIEFNAIDLAYDMALRFAPALAALGLDWRQFVSDWIKVGVEEASHFKALSDRLEVLGASYGDLPAHDGLWETAARTTDDVLARLALAPLVLEARGLDVTPKIIDDLEQVGETTSALILRGIYTDEIGHVRLGAEWFKRVSTVRGLDPEAAFRRLVAIRFTGELKPPFNEEARTAAGLPARYYEAAPAPPGGNR